MPRRPKKQPDISILIPFSTRSQDRRDIVKWLIDYWENELPEAEIVIGRSPSIPFSKTEALNNAAHRANGKVLVIADSDAYLTGTVVQGCADEILANPDDNLWFVPYRKL